MKSLFIITALSTMLLSSQNANALAEFGTLHSSDPGQVVITVDDGNPIKRYCIIELTVKDKKIRWISHPLSEAFVKRDPKFIYNFNDKNLLVASTGKDKKDIINAQVHLYTKADQKLDLLAEEECTDRAEIKVDNKSVNFLCGDKARTVKLSDESKAKTAGLLTSKPIEFKGKTYEVKNGDWRFEIAETDNYFKDRLLVIQKNQVLKEYKASDFSRCFEYETLKGSQDKFSE
jgi:hypothetical protein